MVQKDPDASEEENKATVQAYIDANLLAFGQDVDIWHNKIYVENPLMCSGDGPLHKLRKWYNQFYLDRLEVPSGLDMPKRHF
jgi:3-ketosteroid 9alpha-monooxygenase subunit A